MTWAERNLVSLKAEHLKGSTNQEVDWLGRIDMDSGECSLNWESLTQFTSSVTW